MAFLNGITAGLEMRVLGVNNEKGVRLVYWTYTISTDSNNYLTSNTNVRWEIAFSARDDISAAVDMSYLDTSGYTLTPINTDINDSKVVVEGFAEVDTGDSIKYLDADFKIYLDGIIQVNVSSQKGNNLSGTDTSSKRLTRSAWSRGDSVSSTEQMYIRNFNNFNDEENPVLTHSGVRYASSSNYYKYFTFYISFDGVSRDVVKSIPHSLNSTSGTNVSINFTEEERNIMRGKMPNTTSQEVYIYLASSRTQSYTEYDINRYYCADYVKRTLTIINGEPVFSPVIKDTNATTKALTGNESILVRYYSNAYVASNIELKKKAGSLTSHKITLGSKSTTAQTYTFNQVESNKYVFSATDSRGLSTVKEVSPQFVDYVKLTCAVDNEPIGATSGTMKITIHGNYFSGSFGAYNNNLGLTYRFRLKGTEWGNWIAVSNPSIYGDSYSVDITLTGLNYLNTYEI